jgi:trans-aconitate methyltransferase
MTNQSTPDWQAWLRRWDAQQTGYLPDREERFNAMLHVLKVLLPGRFIALDLACGPGAISQRLLNRFPQARSVAVDLDPVLLTLGQQALGDMGGRLRWVEADLTQADWTAHLGETRFDTVLSTTALHWLPLEDLVRVYKQLGELIRPGGLFLNGDHMKFTASMPSFRKVTEEVLNDEWADERFARLGVENWEQFWSALRQEPALQVLVAARERRFSGRNGSGGNASYDLHEAALREAGFQEVGVIWQRFDDRVLLAVR